ncbi:MAG: hypothetical protein DCC71_00915 [Proteobacteria bacterium]|nr:MAG: hypothetical protein DCC71_00915 [Pseudomonadota bacterium]
MTRRARALVWAAACASLATGAAEAFVSASPIAAACYAAERGCRVQLDPFALEVPLGRRLAHVSIELDGQPVYDFSTDASNPPAGAYVPTLPARGFAARCEESYVLTVRAQDDGDAVASVAAQTDAIPCPVRVPEPEASLAAGAALGVLLARRRRRTRSILRA